MNDPLHWSQIVGNLGQAIGAGAILLASIVGVITYWRNKRREAAQWMHGVFHEFQTGPAFDEAKSIVDFQYASVVEPLHAALVAGGNAAIPPESWQTAHAIDRLLNYLEHVRYLAENGHAKWSDCEAYFGYWFQLLSEPQRGALRRYLVHFGYERLAAIAGAQQEDYILLYGTLRLSEAAHAEHGLSKSLEFVGRRSVRGDLIDLGDYPGLVDGTGTISADLFRIKDTSVLMRLDDVEEVSWQPPNPGLYRRTTTRVMGPARRGPWKWLREAREIDAWIYLYNGNASDGPRIVNETWAEYRARRDKPNAVAYPSQ